MASSLLTYFLLALAALGACQGPVEMKWSEKTYGPDGPWQAISVFVGTDEQKIDLYPGGWFESVILSSSICAGRSPCAASDAGTFNESSSDPAVRPGSYQQPGFVDQWGAGPEMNLVGTGEFMLDKMRIDTATESVDIPNFIFSLVRESNIQLPNGTTYPTQLGFLALGAPSNNTGAKPLTNGSAVGANIIPGFLRLNNIITSNSWGMNIGSVAQNQSGSLILGGYEKSRAIGPVGSYLLQGIGRGEPIVTLKGITLDVETGGTPFNTSNVGNLYRPLTSAGEPLPVSLNPTVPYMQLPTDQCEAIAEFLPVSFNSDLGLYIWNTDDPMYKTIVESPAYIQFSFEHTAAADLNIKVPFSVLDLTLEPPLVAQSQKYFPCKPVDSLAGRYYLGRAFLQAAYLATHWPFQSFFLTQAAGPNSGSSEIVAFDRDVNGMESGSTDFAASWGDKWSVIPMDANGTATAEAFRSPEQSSSGLSTGARVGMSFGIIIGILAVVGISAAVWSALRKRKNATQVPELSGNSDTEKPPVFEVPGERPLPPTPRYGKHEMATPYNDSRRYYHEADSGEVAELPHEHV